MFSSWPETALEEVEQLIRKYRLEEDREHVIVPFHSADGRKKRCFLLKRRYFRIVFGEHHFHDYPLEEVIEATVLYPDMPLRESILLVHKEPEVHATAERKDIVEIRGEGEKKNTD